MLVLVIPDRDEDGRGMLLFGRVDLPTAAKILTAVRDVTVDGRPVDLETKIDEARTGHRDPVPDLAPGESMVVPGFESVGHLATESP